MNFITHEVCVSQLWQWAKSGVTVTGVIAIVKWIWSLRRLRHEIAIKDAALMLRKRADVLLSLTNQASLSRAEWASFLPNPALIDRALAEAGAVRAPGKEDRWVIGNVEHRRFR